MISSWMFAICFCLFGFSSAALNFTWEERSNAPWGKRNPLAGDFYQGDIMLRPGEDPNDRNSITDRNARWPDKTVYYIIDDEYDNNQKNLIRKALSMYHTHTCLKIVESRGNGDYIHVKNQNKGCLSFVGRQGGAQDLSLQLPGCLMRGIIMHEFMHAIGFWHEQARTDRDDFVEINWNNILPNHRYNFDKKNANIIDHLNTSYDYKSLMHYEAWDFAVDPKKPTIYPKHSGWTLKDLGSAAFQGVFTETDSLKIKRFYECE